MALFGKLFSKEACAFCGKEVGAMHRSKLKGGDFACNECAAKCSEFVRLSEMEKDTVEAHIQFMEKRSAIYDNQFKGKAKNTFFNNRRNYGLAFCDELGMVAIINFKNKRQNTEVLRYDEIASYADARDEYDRLMEEAMAKWKSTMQMWEESEAQLEADIENYQKGYEEEPDWINY